MEMEGRVWLIGCGAQGTVILYCLGRIFRGVVEFVVVDKRA